jgi:general secretion pathway protein G
MLPAALLSACVSAVALAIPPMGATPETTFDLEPGTYLRVADDGQRVALEIASRDFVPVDGSGPRVGLIAVAHIGDASFYRQMQSVLGEYELVLYESVMPPGARGPAGETDAERHETTRAALEFVGTLVEAHRFDRRGYPEDLDALALYLDGKDSRLVTWMRAATVDAWGKPARYERTAAGFALTSLGADGQPGGVGHAADVVVDARAGLEPIMLGDEDNIQAQLASTLDLAFQLEAIDYDHANWRCSDMAMDQVALAMRERGLDFEPLAGQLTGASLPAKMVSFLLRLVKFADMFLGGVIADTAKVAMIEMLGDPVMMDQALSQMGEGFTEVIVDLRNQTVVDDLQAVIANERDVESVAIFYGAAHMPDLEERLADQLSYRPATPVDGAGKPAPAPVRWFRAIEVDLARSAINKRDLDQIRRMMRQSMGG